MESVLAPPDPSVVERLIAAADGTVRDTERALADLAPETVAGVLLAELAARLEVSGGPPAPARVQLDLGRLGYVLALGPDGLTAKPGRMDAPWTRLRQDPAELVRAVFGAAGDWRDATRELIVAEEPRPDANGGSARWDDRQASVRALAALTAACEPRTPDLTALATRCASDKWGVHFYTPYYQRHLAPYADQRVRVLEIGIGGYQSPEHGGASLRMWRQYFRRGLVHGLDIHDKSALERPRMRTHRGDQGDAAFLAALADEIGPLDIVIDDGSHLSGDVLASFGVLFDRLAPGGLYVIEDLQTSYWPGWNGGHTDPDAPSTTVGHLKALVDGLHHRERPAASAPTDRTVGALHLYPNIAFVEKGLSSERAAPSWLPRDTGPNGRISTPGQGD
ncbi:class I SAM-dependent methyltransferase [Spirillospora sp. NPDC049652]